MKRNRAVFLVLLTLVFTVGINGTVTSAENSNEWRAFWVVRGGDLTTPARIDSVIANHVDLNLTAALVQVNGRFASYYPSDLVPQAPGIEVGFDPLAYFIEQAQAVGLEVHAWVNAFTASPFGNFPEDRNHVVHTHPEWVTHDSSGESILGYGREHAVVDVIPAVFLEPGLPEVQNFVTAMVREIAAKYAVDGIHLDYIRYPSPNFGYHPANRSRFAAAYGIDPLDMVPWTWLEAEEWTSDQAKLLEAWDQFRRDNITNVMRHIYWEIKRLRPDVLVSAAVVAELENDFAQRRRFQDWPAWVQEGIVDAVLPMAYSPDPSIVLRQLKQARAVTAGTEVLLKVGIGAYQMEDPWQLEQVVTAARHQVQPDGIALFSYGSSTSDPQYMEHLRTRIFPAENGKDR